MQRRQLDICISLSFQTRVATEGVPLLAPPLVTTSACMTEPRAKATNASARLGGKVTVVQKTQMSVEATTASTRPSVSTVTTATSARVGTASAGVTVRSTLMSANFPSARTAATALTNSEPTTSSASVLREGAGRIVRTS